MVMIFNQNNSSAISENNGIGSRSWGTPTSLINTSAGLALIKPKILSDLVTLNADDSTNPNDISNQYSKMGREEIMSSESSNHELPVSPSDSKHAIILEDDEFMDTQNYKYEIGLAQLLLNKPYLKDELEKTNLGKQIDTSDDGKISREELINFVDANPEQAKDMAKSAINEKREIVYVCVAGIQFDNEEPMYFFEPQRLSPFAGEKVMVSDIEKTKLGKRIDTSHDGKIDTDEIMKFMVKHPTDSIELIQQAILESTVLADNTSKKALEGSG